MAIKPSLGSAKRPFVDTILSCSALLGAIGPYTEKKNTYDAINGWQPLHPAQARRVVGLSFVIMVSAWEEFVQSAFIRYMAGGISDTGYAPTLQIGPCKNMVHAGQVLTQNSKFDFDSSYITWSSWKNVVDRAKIFFKDGKPFASIDNARKERLKDAFIIRNRVAHLSGKCRAEFVEVAKKHLKVSKLRRGFDVGELLLAPPKLFGPQCERDIYFAAYMDLFMELADVIAPERPLIAEKYIAGIPK